MYPYLYNQQSSVDRINANIAELEKMKAQMQQPVPTNLTQNFQIAPSNNSLMRYANTSDEVQKAFIVADTPFFSKDMSVLWVKNTSGEVKTYELKEIIKKDEKDLQIEFLKAKIDELEKGLMYNAKSNDEYVDEPIKSKKSSNAKSSRANKTKAE